jgi:hypothetical protein
MQRGHEDLPRQGVHEWVEAKFRSTRKAELRSSLCPDSLSRELVAGTVRHEEEVDLLQQAGVTIHRLKNILAEMADKRSPIRAASRADLFDLMRLRE